MKGSSWHVLVGKQSFGPYSMAGLPTFAAKGKGMAWPAMGKRGRAVILLGKKKTAKGNYDAVGMPRFTPNGKKLAFAASRGQEMLVVFGKQKLSGNYTAVGPACFDSHSKRIAFAARVGGAPMMMGPIIKDFTNIKFSNPPGLVAPPGPTASAAKWSLVVDGERKPLEFDQVADPVFSPNGKVVAYRARTGTEWSVVVGKQSSVACQQVGKPVFFDDGKKIAFGCVQDRELWWQVMEVK